MDLQSALSREEFDGLSDEEALALLNVSVELTRDDSLWSYSGVAVQFGDQAAEGLLQAIQSAGMAGAAQVYLTRGMQLSLAAVQDKLTAIAITVPDLANVCNALKEIGVPHGPSWRSYGISDEPTVESVHAARLVNSFVATCESAAAQVRSGSMSIEEAKAEIAQG